jgi:molecular chaperone DnaK
LNEGVFQVLATNGNTRLGGDDLDARVVDWLTSKIAESGGPDLKMKGGLADLERLPLVARLREAAEQAKVRLSTEPEVEVSLPFLTPQFSFSARLTRAELESLTRDLIERTRTHCLRSLADAKLDPAELDQVILVGGQTRMPLVRRLASEWFGCGEFESVAGGLRVGEGFHRAKGPVLNTGQNPDEAVALGAAVQAEILTGGFKHLLLLDVTPLSLGLETFGGLMNVIIPRNSTIPIKAGEVFTTAVDHQPGVLIHVLQGERERARDNWSLGKFTLHFERAPKGVPRVGVQFEIDANGILHVLARDLRTGEQKIVEMKSAVDVDDAAVQRMVEESVEHAFGDLAARRWVEAKLKAEETLAATRNALAAAAREIEPAYRGEVEGGVERVLAALRTEAAETQTGDLARLQAAHRELDVITQRLADVLMERAVEAMLQRRGLSS